VDHILADAAELPHLLDRLRLDRHGARLTDLAAS
jgi:hypothetical protein